MQRRALLALLAAIPAAAQAQTEPQPELPKEPLIIVTRDNKRHVFSVEMALTPEQQTVGLMFRRTVPQDGGMLFDWGGVITSRMWMRNTISSLDMLFIAPNGTIHHIAERTIPQSLAIIDGGPARATIELAAGTAERLNIHVGDKVLQRIFNNAG